MVAAAMALIVPTATAQKINEDATLAKLTKSDAEVKDAKKSAKASVWVNRAKVYADALMEPTKALSTSLDATFLRYTMGEPTETVADEQGRQIWVYPWVKVYMSENRVAAWEQTREIKEGIFDVLVEAVAKAQELDAKADAKVKPLLDLTINYYSQLGEISTFIPNYAVAIDAFVKAAKLQENKIYSQVDPKYYFFAGQMSAFLGAENKQYFIDGENYLNKARELGYVDETGNLYYYLFHCYYGQREDNKENLVKAKNILLEGIEKFPKNDKILDGLMSLYTAEEGVGDPAELVEMIDKFLAETPDNPDLWFGRGRVFYKLKNFDECITSFKKIDALKPNDYDTNFYIGYFYVEKAEHENRLFNQKLDSFTSQEEYMAERKKVRSVYMESIPYLEKAHELNPQNVDCAQILKEVCFLLREEPGVMDKYNKYNAEYKKLKGLE
ncbi:MAG: hypothetical protein E7143_05445 [Rikenellaceae bacterium]|nr:hypothetical protein [Rikenellaceae bacterium]